MRLTIKETIFDSLVHSTRVPSVAYDSIYNEPLAFVGRVVIHYHHPLLCFSCFSLPLPFIPLIPLLCTSLQAWLSSLTWFELCVDSFTPHTSTTYSSKFASKEQGGDAKVKHQTCVYTYIHELLQREHFFSNRSIQCRTGIIS